VTPQRSFGLGAGKLFLREAVVGSFWASYRGCIEHVMKELDAHDLLELQH
jgi:hypothetical protein